MSGKIITIEYILFILDKVDSFIRISSMYKRNIYIFLIFVSLTTRLFAQIPDSKLSDFFKTRWLFLGTSTNTIFSTAKDSRFETGFQRGIGAGVFVGLDLFSVISIRTDLHFTQISSSFPYYGITYRGYTSASNDFRLDIQTKYPLNELSNLEISVGLFGGLGYSFGSYTATALLFYYTQIFGGPKLEIFERRSDFYSFAVEIPFTYQFRKDLERSFSISINFGVTLYPILLLEMENIAK